MHTVQTENLARTTELERMALTAVAIRLTNPTSASALLSAPRRIPATTARLLSKHPVLQMMEQVETRLLSQVAWLVQ